MDKIVLRDLISAEVYYDRAVANVNGAKSAAEAARVAWIAFVAQADKVGLSPATPIRYARLGGKFYRLELVNGAAIHVDEILVEEPA